VPKILIIGTIHGFEAIFTKKSLLPGYTALGIPLHCT